MPPPLLGFLGLFAGGWKLAIVAAAVLAVCGRRFAPFASRWLAVTNQRKGGSGSSKQEKSLFGDRLYILLLVMAATAVATWILAHYTIARGVR
jgi:hypothetical protein